MVEASDPQARRRLILIIITLATIPCYCIGGIAIMMAPDSSLTATPTPSLTLPVFTATQPLQLLTPSPAIISPTASVTPSITPSPTMTYTPTMTPSKTPTWTFLPPSTNTPTSTFTPSATFTPSLTFTPTNTFTATSTFMSTSSVTPSITSFPPQP